VEIKKGEFLMEYIHLGRTGLKVSRLCLGTMQFGWTADEPTSHQVLSAALAAGINFIDTADVYSRWVEGNPGGVAETIIGNWMAQNKVPRSQVVLATKVRHQVGPDVNDQGLSRVHILRAVEASLRRLQTDYIDLYQAHFFDENTPIEETLRAFDDLVRQGKVRYIGASNYPVWRLMQALWAADKNHTVTYQCLQPHYNLVHREEFESELEDVCRTYGLGVIPYSPLAGGFLTGKYRPDRQEGGSHRHVDRYFDEKNWALLAKLDQIAVAHAASVSQVSLAWLLARPVVTSPIIGPRSLEQLQDNLGSLDVKLGPEELVE
jgi:aryl-alcohol dehydrogenase-like predicted oxidoreductase